VVTDTSGSVDVSVSHSGGSTVVSDGAEVAALVVVGCVVTGLEPGTRPIVVLVIGTSDVLGPAGGSALVVETGG
jgi:hypothetical protein